MKPRSKSNDRLLLVGCLLCVFASSAAATTAVVLWTPDEIVIAADGKVTRTGDPNLKSFKTCKIREANGFWFTAAGLYNSSKTGFDLWATLEAAARRAGCVEEAARIAEREIDTALRRILSPMTPAQRRRFDMDTRGVYASFVFAGVQDSSLVVYGREFFSGNDGNLAMDTLSYPLPDNPSEKRAGKLLGVQDAVQKFISENRKWVNAASIEDAARKFVEVEIQEGSDYVGPPLSMLRLTADGPDWLEHGGCAASSDAVE